MKIVVCIDDSKYDEFELNKKYKVLGTTVEKLSIRYYYDISGYNGLYKSDIFISESDWIIMNRDNIINDLIK